MILFDFFTRILSNFHYANYICALLNRINNSGHVMLRGRYMFLDINPAESGAVDMGFNVDVNRFLDQVHRINWF